MRYALRTALALLLVAALCPLAGAQSKGSKDEAVAMVKKAVAYLKANGRDKALAEISNTQGMFVDRDLYVVVYDMQGNCLAHGANAKQVGKNLSLRHVKKTISSSFSCLNNYITLTRQE